MHWILQTGFHAEAGWSALLGALERFGIAYSAHAVVPRIGELVPPTGVAHRNVVCIGSYSMRHAATRHGWSPGVFDLIHQDFEQQRAHWGRHMLNFDSRVQTLCDADFDGDHIFVRPVADSKHFTGKVFARDEFVEWRDAACAADAAHGTSLAPDTLVQLNAPLSIHAEYRFWVVAGEIATCSMYRRGGRIHYSGDIDRRLGAYVEARIAEWMPHESFVIDVCDTPDGIRIVEINTLNSSSFYAADVQKLVSALQAAYSTSGD